MIEIIYLLLMNYFLFGYDEAQWILVNICHWMDNYCVCMGRIREILLTIYSSAHAVIEHMDPISRSNDQSSPMALEQYTCAWAVHSRSID